MSNKESLEFMRSSVAERMVMVEFEISKWDRHDACECVDCPDSPRCLYLTERDILKRLMDCIDRQLHNITHS